MSALHRSEVVPTIDIPGPYLLFLGDVTEAGYAKTAFGLRDWAPERCLAEYACPEATISLGLPLLEPAQAVARGARSMVIGVVNSGGFIADRWIPYLVRGLESGLDLVSGMHARLEDTPAIKAAAAASGRRLINVRHPPAGIPTGSGRKRSGRRLLTVGTDCVAGKKYTALAITRAFRARGVVADFRATGQTGIMIAGGGMPMDAVVSDFEAGAAEVLSPDADARHWDVIEGQGALSHPAYAAVSLGLLHGSQPDVVVVCHQPGRAHVMGLPEYPLPPISEVIELSLRLGRLTNPGIRCAGVSLNTAAFDSHDARALLARESQRLGLPVADPVRGGAEFDQLIEACLE